MRLSKQKYSSNVVEKLMMHCTDEQRNRLLKNMLEVHERTGIVSVILLAQDPIGNYVVKRAVETATDGEEKQELWDIFSENRNELVSFNFS